jgi:sugar phosphate isomerase/epimerase
MKDWKYVLSSAIIAPKTAPILLQGSLEECLKNASRLGYNGVEYHSRENADIHYAEVADAMEKYNVKVSAIITGRLFTEGGYSLLNDDLENSKTAMNGMLMYADMCSKLKCDMVLGWAKGNVPAGADRNVYLDRLGGQLREIETYAEQKGVKIFIEVINRYETNLFNTAKELVDFLDKQKLTNCFVHLDTFHMNIEESDMCEAIRLSADRLGYFHLADNTRWYPGHGMLDFKKIISTLEDVNYNGYLSVECLPNPDGETAASLALKDLLA